MVIQLGMFGFGELANYADVSVATATSAQKLEEFKELARITEAVGLDVFGVGEHHREEFAVSAPPVVLASLAEHTRHIRLASVLTVLASDDPVRVLEQFATLDAICGGRAELYVGRDAFPEAFTLFGHRLADDDRLLEEKLHLLLELQRTAKVTWSGNCRPPLRDATVTPRPSLTLPIGVTVCRGAGPVALAARSAVPLTIHAGTGQWHSYAYYTELYRQLFDVTRHSHPQQHVTILVPAHIADTCELATDQAERFYGPAHTETRSGAASVHGGPMVVGDPETVVDQLLYLHSLLKPQRVLLELGRGNMPIEHVVRAVELFGDHVAGVVRREVAAGDD